MINLKPKTGKQTLSEKNRLVMQQDGSILKLKFMIT